MEEQNIYRAEVQPALIAANILNCMPNAKRKDGQAWQPADLMLSKKQEKPKQMSGEEQQNFFRIMNLKAGGKEMIL